jgi:hypothetical protein
MTAAQFREIREALGLTPAELALILDYERVNDIHRFEREGREIPRHVAMLMRGYWEGYRPKNWPCVK